MKTRFALAAVVAAALLAMTFAVTPPAVRADGWHDGLAAYDRGDYATALRLWRPYAARGDVEAQYNLGALYDQGLGVPQDDAQAVKWYRLAAAQGDADAQYRLGLKHHNGEGVPQDDAEAAKWYRLAAEQGQSDAQRNLAAFYFAGQGVPQDLVRAHLWFALAGAQGDTLSAGLRETVSRYMTPAQIAEAKRLARAWKPKE